MSTSPYNNAEKGVNLSPLEQKLYFNFYEKEVFRTGDAYRQLADFFTLSGVQFRIREIWTD